MDELSDAKDKAEEANRMKSQFVSMISHELRTPLTSIIGYTQLIESNVLGDLTEKQKESLTSIESSAKDLLHLINDLIDISKIDLRKFSLNFSEVELEEFIKEIDQEVSYLVEKKGLEFRENFDDIPEKAIFDRLRIKQVIVNLISNAIKFTEEGHILFDIKRVNTMRYSKKSHKKGKYLQFSVIDCGEGIDKEELEKIWDMFYRIDNKLTRKTGGTGLGLSISKNIVKLHKGRFLVDSKKGEGSRFTFVIPINQNF